MPIERAAAKHIPLIEVLLTAAGIPYTPHDPPDPPIEGAEPSLPLWMSGENEYVFVDTDAGAVARISINHEDKTVALVWHVPQTLPVLTLMPVLRAAVLVLVAAHPEVSTYQRYSEHYSEDISRKWQDVLPGSTVMKLLTNPPRWRLTLPPPPVNPDDPALLRDVVEDWPAAMEP